jgi:hypothetical protein
MKQKKIHESYHAGDSQCPSPFSDSQDYRTCPICANEDNGTLNCLHCSEYSCLEGDEDFIWEKITATGQGPIFLNMPRKIEASNIASLLFIGLVIVFLFIH